jgi:cleavage and polyadenylation specificity factor subunit 3
MKIFQTYLNMMGPSVKAQFRQGLNPFDFKFIQTLKSLEGEGGKEVKELGKRGVVMASPGMMQSGLSRELFEKWCHDSRNGCIVTGYCVENTLAK